MKRPNTAAIWACPHGCTAPCRLECARRIPKLDSHGRCCSECSCECHADYETHKDRDLVGCICGRLFHPEERLPGMQLDRCADQNGACLRPKTKRNVGAASPFSSSGGCWCPECGAQVHKEFVAWAFGMPHTEGELVGEWCDFCAPLGSADGNREVCT